MVVDPAKIHLTAGQLSGREDPGIVPAEPDEDGAAALLGDDGLDVGFDDPAACDEDVGELLAS